MFLRGPRGRRGLKGCPGRPIPSVNNMWISVVDEDLRIVEQPRGPAAAKGVRRGELETPRYEQSSSSGSWGMVCSRRAYGLHLTRFPPYSLPGIFYSDTGTRRAASGREGLEADASYREER